MITRVKASEVAKYREAILKVQGNKCAVCGTALRATTVKRPVLDHCHTRGHLRGVLCIMCNQAEGRIRTWTTRAKGPHTQDEWLARLLAYLSAPPKYKNYLHPTFKTEDEKRTARNKRAKIKRAQAKAEK